MGVGGILWVSLGVCGSVWDSVRLGGRHLVTVSGSPLASVGVSGSLWVCRSWWESEFDWVRVTYCVIVYLVYLVYLDN